MSIIRIRFGRTRRECGCRQCTIACVEMPGFLIPEDLERMAAGEPIEEWAQKHLLASPGAAVLAGGEIVRIPTLVPRRSTVSAGCHWLAQGRCMVHDEAPFGCAFFNVCDPPSADDDLMSRKALIQIMQDWRSDGPYSRIWQMLDDADLCAPGPEEGRERMSRILP